MTTLNTAASGRLEILITTYTTYKQNQEKINMIEWDAVIADECHVIKERKSDVTVQMALINSRVRIGLTGTAIQNNYEVTVPIYHVDLIILGCCFCTLFLSIIIVSVCLLGCWLMCLGIMDVVGLD